jgi:2-iminobutanoate/2-iminopropanoate deaminase
VKTRVRATVARLVKYPTTGSVADSSVCKTGVMSIRQINPTGVFPPYANYAHAVEVAAGSRLLFISGLNGYAADGNTMPEDFEGQAEIIWSHLETILVAADMSIENLVSLRFYLAEPALDPANVRLLKQRLGNHHAARTVICAGFLESRWLIEVEAVAAAS